MCVCGWVCPLMLSQLHGFSVSLQCRSEKRRECHLHTLMCSVTVVFIHTMEDDQRLNTLVHEGDTLRFRIARRQKSL